MKVMMRAILVIVFTLTLFSANQIKAQTSANLTSNDLVSLGLNEMSEENWSFYSDDDDQIYYIDFEKISFNLSDVIVKNHLGEVIFKDEVLGLPVNTIYELDFGVFGKGKYEIELRSFTGFLKKEVEIK